MTGVVEPKGPPNPYIGPRAFQRGERLPAREREAAALADLIIAERVVLLYAPSGAGKTSLIDAGLPTLLRDGRLVPTPLLRVKTPAPTTRKVRNRYVHSVALDLLAMDLPEDTLPPDNLAALELSEIVKKVTAGISDGFLVLLLDQLEEVLFLDPTDRTGHSIFFAELGDALADGSVWALLSIREDYMGGLDPFVRYVPGYLATRYRLDYLDRGAAALAIQWPAADVGVEFTDGATTKLIGKMATATKQTVGGGEKEVPAQYVQPVQLQVVCNELWRSVSREKRAKGEKFRSIEVEDVERQADVPAALGRYYAGIVDYVANATGADEGDIRRWVESDLISPQHFRSQTLAGPVSGTVDPADVLRALEDGYFIRGDRRADSTWWEVAHDKLVQPILDDNHRWMRPKLQPWQLAAREWDTIHDPARLLTGLELIVAERQADASKLTGLERRFLEASRRAEQERGVLIRTQLALRRFGLLASFELGVIVVLAALLLFR